MVIKSTKCEEMRNYFKLVQNMQNMMNYPNLTQNENMHDIIIIIFK